MLAMGITPQQFNELQERLKSPRRAPQAVHGPLVASSASRLDHELVIGVDPSLRGTGYGVIRMSKPHPVALTHGTITCPQSWEHSRCLVRIAQTLREVVQQHKPTICVIEALFYAQNLQTTLVMGECRGAALVALGEAGLEIYELAARKVKLAVVGYGAAQKLAVAKMVQRLLHLEAPPAPDAADALALALTYSQEQRRYSLRPPKRI